MKKRDLTPKQVASLSGRNLQQRNALIRQYRAQNGMGGFVPRVKPMRVNANRGQFSNTLAPAGNFGDPHYDAQLTEAAGILRFMFDPAHQPAVRIATDSASYTAIAKSTFFADLESSGKWDPMLNQTMPWVSGEFGASVAYAYPGSAACIWHTLGTPVGNANPLNSSDTGSHWFPWHIAADTPDGALSETQVVAGRNFFSHSVYQSVLRVGMIPRLNSLGIPVYEMTILAQATQAVAGMRFGFTAISSTTGAPVAYGNLQPETHITTYNRVGDILNVTAIGQMLDEQGLIEVDVPTVDTADSDGAVTAFSLHYEEDDDPDVIWLFTFRGHNDGSTEARMSIPAHSATAYRVDDMPEFTTLAQTSDEITTGLDMLVTYMGSSLNDGGQISSARLPPNYSPNLVSDGDLYAFFTRLPNEKYQGALKDGTHIVWLPKSERELDSVPSPGARSRVLRNTSTIVTAMNRDDNRQTVRLTISGGIEFATNSVTYDTDVAVPNKMIMIAIAHALKLPAGTSNPSHLEIIRQGLGKVFRFLTKPANILKAGKTLLGVAGIRL
jgi:hypothetical protein